MFAIAFQVLSSVFCMCLDTCFKCFIYLLLYVANVKSGCFKSRLGVGHVAMVFQVYVPNI
jgi:hypothetical protein